MKACSFNSCLICNVKFNKRDIREKRTLCYKANCEYLYALKQKDLWSAKAHAAKVRADEENGEEQPAVFAEAEEDDEVEEVMDSGSVEVFNTCMFPNCCKQLKVSNIENMSKGSVEFIKPYDRAEDSSIGRCRQCDKAGLYPYWCIKHYKQHNMHHHGSTASFYSSNLDPMPQLPQLPQLPKDDMFSKLPDLSQLSYNDDFDFGLDLELF